MRLLLPPLFTLALGLWLAVSGTQAQYDDLSMAFIQMNQARQIKRISPLAWDNDLAMYAQYWADQIATGAVPFSHAPPSLRPQQGENLYQRQSSQPDWAYYNTFQTAVAAWVEEGPLWRGQAVGDGSEPWLHWCKTRTYILPPG
jgi:hypothetical protein